jgi:glycosyltransferase involved in cell wall biosynthesis
LGDAVIYFNPLNIDDMAEKIKTALVNREVREDLIKRGFEQIKKYSWSQMAKETLEIYKTILG